MATATSNPDTVALTVTPPNGETAPADAQPQSHVQPQSPERVQEINRRMGMLFALRQKLSEARAALAVSKARSRAKIDELASRCGRLGDLAREHQYQAAYVARFQTAWEALDWAQDLAELMHGALQVFLTHAVQ